MTYTRDHAVLPSKNILMFIAVICALLFFANIVRRTWLLPASGWPCSPSRRSCSAASGPV